MPQVSTYNKETIEKIFAAMCSGLSAARACSEYDVSERNFYYWMSQADQGDQEKAWMLQEYLRAREAQADSIFDECLDLSDMADVENVQVKKLQIDTRMRMAGKLKPKKYGEKSQPGETPDNPVYLAGIDVSFKS